VNRTSVNENWLDVWGGPLSGNATVVVMLNRDNDNEHEMTAWWSDLNVSCSNCSVFDLIEGEMIGYFSGSYSANVSATSVVAVKIAPVTMIE